MRMDFNPVVVRIYNVERYRTRIWIKLKGIDMETQIYTPQSHINLREAIENATKMARATGKKIIIKINDARFSVGPDTKMQDAIDAYMEVKRKMHETEQKLKQNEK